MDATPHAGTGKRRNSLSVEAANAISNLTQSFAQQLRTFILGTGAFSVAAAVLPIAAIFLLRETTYEIALDFFGDSASNVPPILYNTTVVSFTPETRSLHFCESAGALGAVSTLMATCICLFWVSTWLTMLLRCHIMFRMATVGKAVNIFIALTSMTICTLLHIKELKYQGEHGVGTTPTPVATTFPAMVALLPPAMFTVAFITNTNTSTNDNNNNNNNGSLRPSLLKVYFIFFTALLLEVMAQTIYAFMVIPYFFREDTSTLNRFLVRMLGQVILLYFGVEISWRWTAYAKEHLGVETKNAAVATFGFYACVVPLLGRVMQGSAETLAQSVIYEVAGTIAELFLADSFLKSKTPIVDSVLTAKALFAGCGQSLNKVKPHAPMKRRLTRSLLTGLERWERIFCETCMIMLTIIEASSLLSSSLFWLLLKANPNKAGSPAIPEAQTITSLGIMLFGELIVTDGAIAYASNKFQGRYVVNIASAWTELIADRANLIWYLVGLSSLITVWVTLNLPTNMCFTSPISDEENWAITSCPQWPVDIGQMARVSASYQNLWLEAKNSTNNNSSFF
ncbi:hypothetical protein TrVE_jg4977 [Triparma verrucosa]|uniref:Transmembrane protein n=1 Tax=Triparma verrucosa TaxID=1606542 RepID=A0A9W7CN53_9STRA|nr:hypothetical protein TrVE_jg4977 [Triparma verrucosa]